MKTTLPIAALCLIGIGSFSAQDKKTPDPTPRKDAILKLFAEEFVAITPGKGKFPDSFMMGTEKGGHDNERPAHKVTFKYAFAMAKYEVTQELYHVVVGHNPAKFQGRRNGIDRVSWDARTRLRKGDEVDARGEVDQRDGTDSFTVGSGMGVLLPRGNDDGMVVR